MKKLLIALVLALTITVGTAAASSTVVKGHQDRYDTDNNGYPDEGQEVNGHYTSLYAYDASGDYYWDLGDGRIRGTVGSVDDLNQQTLTTCDYIVNYRGTFDNDAFMDSGWIMNNIKCRGYAGKSNYKYNIVHETDPRYTGNPDWAIWGTWEHDVYVVGGEGNLVRPYTNV